MKLIHTAGYNKIERQAHREIVFSNTIQSMQAVLEALSGLGLELEVSRDAYAVAVRKMSTHIQDQCLPQDVGESLRALWADPAVKEAVSRSREFQLNDSAI
jgi:guanine nucleotide-binding protein G(i) subunit alpha